MPRNPLHVAFLGCGYITRVHSYYVRRMGGDLVASYASRDSARAEAYRSRHGGLRHYGSYEAALNDPTVDAVVVAVPPKHHRELTLQALAMGKHVLVEKPAFPLADDFQEIIDARDRAGRVVLVGENDHYKPLAIRLRQLLANDVVGEVVFMSFATVMEKPKTATDWRNDETMAGGDAFFEDGIHWLHVAGSLGPNITTIEGFRPSVSSTGALRGDARRKSMLVAFRYDNGAVGTIYYSREIPSLLRGARFSKIFGRSGVITFESNGGFIIVRGRGTPKFILPGFRDIRGYGAMYRDFVGAINNQRSPEMSLERSREDHRLIELVYATADARQR